MIMMDVLQITLKHWLFLTTLTFSLGLYSFLVKQNLISILIALEIMFNAVAMNFVIFNQYIYADLVDGKIMAIFIIAITAIETVVSLAILILLFRVKQSNQIKYLLMKTR